MVNYVTNAQFCDIVRNNLHKIPHDIDGVIGVPRGGMLVASIISEMLNIPLYSVESFLEGHDIGGGFAMNFVRLNKTNKFVVVDDSVGCGNTFIRLKQVLSKCNATFVYVAAVCDDKNSFPFVDIVLSYVNEPRLFEMNMFRLQCVENMIFDIDGVLCNDPPSGIDLDETRYIEFMLNAKPKYKLLYKPLALCTHRLMKYAPYTQKWLSDNGIEYGNLCMLDLGSIEEKIRLCEMPQVKNMKATVYNAFPNAILFVESNMTEAEYIFNTTGRPVLCTDTNQMLQ